MQMARKDSSDRRLVICSLLDIVGSGFPRRSVLLSLGVPHGQVSSSTFEYFQLTT